MQWPSIDYCLKLKSLGLTYASVHSSYACKKDSKAISLVTSMW